MFRREGEVFRLGTAMSVSLRLDWRRDGAKM
jgi:hypothetical protein